jgi:hypothetical protein
MGIPGDERLGHLGRIMPAPQHSTRYSLVAVGSWMSVQFCDSLLLVVVCCSRPGWEVISQTHQPMNRKHRGGGTHR